MTVRPHESQHEKLADLPLVTERATVTEVAQLDRDREGEAKRALRRWLDAETPEGSYAVPERRSQWSTLVETLRGDGQGELARRAAAIQERVDRPEPMLVRVALRTRVDFDYLPGQYVGFKFDGNSRAYSLASSPTGDELEICVRRVADGRLSPRLCRDLAPGDEVAIRGPYGDLLLQDASARDMVFVATGTGVAPFKGMIDYVFETGYDEVGGERRDVWLFLGAAWEDDLPYRREFRELAAERENFHFVPCLSREPYLTNWGGETDYVQHALMKYVDEDAVTAPIGVGLEARLRRTPKADVTARIDPNDVEVYACGINAMVYSLVEEIERIGVSPDVIESEGFG